MNGLTADKLAQAYQLTDLYRAGRSGEGVTVGVIGLGPYSPTDIATFASCYGISSPNVRGRRVLGGPFDDSNPDHTDFVIETILSIAPAAQIRVYRVSENSIRDWNSALDAAVSDRVQIISVSSGWCEEYAHGYFRGDFDRQAQLLSDAATHNQTVIASSGNLGMTCEPLGTMNHPETHDAVGISVPASSEWVTAVGGTTLKLEGGQRSETVWNNTSNGASGGGISRYAAMPDWQRPLGDIGDSSGVPCQGVLGTVRHHPTPLCREVPDVSADADPSTGYVVYENGRWRNAGGTSGAAPLWAGLVALMDEGCGGDPAGFLNPKLYAAAADSGYPNGPGSAFHDITTGDNDLLGLGKYQARVGYDLASGLGTPDGWNLTRYLSCKPAVSSVAPSSGPTTGGTTTTITGSGFAWTPASGTSPGLTVTFGGTRAARIDVVSPTEIQVQVPPGIAGQVDVTVTTPAGTSAHSTADHYTYVGPVVVDVNGPGFSTHRGATSRYQGDPGPPSEGSWATYNSAKLPPWYTESTSPTADCRLPARTTFTQLSAQPADSMVIAGVLAWPVGLWAASHYDGQGTATYTATPSAGLLNTTYDVYALRPSVRCLHWHSNAELAVHLTSAVTHEARPGRPAGGPSPTKGWDTADYPSSYFTLGNTARHITAAYPTQTTWQLIAADVHPTTNPATHQLEIAATYHSTVNVWPYSNYEQWDLAGPLELVPSAPGHNHTQPPTTP